MEGKVDLFWRIFSAFLFSTVSVLLVIINKVVLTTYRFPSILVLAIGQVTSTIVLLSVAKHLLKVISFPDLSTEIPRKLWPLPLLYLFNMLFGLGGTQKLNLPMFTVLRRFAIFFTLLGEKWILGVEATWTTHACVCSMIIGAIVAASGDLTFDIVGYTFITINNIYTAANGVYTKKLLDTKDLGTYGILYYNALFSIVPLCCIAFMKDDFHTAAKFESWNEPVFVVQFVLSSIMGSLLMYSMMLCTQYNSALTTNIVGVLKNLVITYLGMLVGGDYVFTWVNFIGLNISTVGSVVYTYTSFTSRATPSPVPPPKVTVVSKEEETSEETDLPDVRT